MSHNPEAAAPLSLHRVPRALMGDIDSEWATDGVENPPHTGQSYEDSFAPFLYELGANTFSDYLSERKALGKNTHVLDLFGGGYFLQDLDSVDSITGVRLEDIDERIEQELLTDVQSLDLSTRQFYQDQLSFFQTLKRFDRREVIEGNLFRFKTWDQINTSMRNRGIPAFDMIVCRPVGPFMPRDYFDVNGEDNRTLKITYLRLLRNAYNLLGSNDGILMSEIPEGVYTEDAYRGSDLRQLEDLVSANNISITISGSEYDIIYDSYQWNDDLVFMLQKDRNAPQNFNYLFKQLLVQNS